MLLEFFSYVASILCSAKTIFYSVRPMLELFKVCLDFARIIFKFYRNYFGLCLNFSFSTIVLRKIKVHVLTSRGATSSDSITPMGVIK